MNDKIIPYEPDKYLLSIDYLICNLLDKSDEPTPESISLKFIGTDFHFELQEFGTTVFKHRYFVSYNNEKIGVLLACPHSPVIASNLMQFQFENHLFYTKQLYELKKILSDFCDIGGLHFSAVNRLDVAIDLVNTEDFYQNTVLRILNNDLVISGKDKKVSPYYVTEQGKPKLTGFTIGSRTSSRFMRCYNKTLELTKKPKEYILNAWEERKIPVHNVWRLEYQMNNSFFRYLEKAMSINNENLNLSVSEPVTWGIFNPQTLMQLMEAAQKNHFEIRYNTQKSQINKEMPFTLINWDYFKTLIGNFACHIRRVKKIVEPSLLTVKRLVKGMFREYYQSKQENVSYVLGLNNLIDDYDSGLTNIRQWFHVKLPYYIREFEKKQTADFEFDNELFSNHQLYAI
ncbi:replication initiation factor domain-containing protein [Flavobacterium sp. 3HN19-14]|uniref:replication initiation factor domain-containing protein n=1 Tax=Flavobacterium sp. 3HN19-14 TaxID=3448133 RepID=UPI003EE05A3E